MIVGLLAISRLRLDACRVVDPGKGYMTSDFDEYTQV